MESRRLVWRNKNEGFVTLIGLLLVILIIAILFTMYGRPVGDREDTTVVGGVRERAQDTLCRNNLSQYRAAVSTQVAMTGEFPPTISELVPEIAAACPEGGEPYQYNPQNGTIQCVHPGHESF